MQNEKGRGSEADTRDVSVGAEISIFSTLPCVGKMPKVPIDAHETYCTALQLERAQNLRKRRLVRREQRAEFHRRCASRCSSGRQTFPSARGRAGIDEDHHCISGASTAEGGGGGWSSVPNLSSISSLRGEPSWRRACKFRCTLVSTNYRDVYQERGGYG